MPLCALRSHVCGSQPRPGAAQRPHLLSVGRAEARSPSQALEVDQAALETALWL